MNLLAMIGHSPLLIGRKAVGRQAASRSLIVMERQFMSGATQRTAFVFAGGGSLGAIQVGMLRVLMRQGLNADFVVGSSVGALNAAYYEKGPRGAGHC
jgi:predicted acylesterase/phospholipase RssA